MPRSRNSAQRVTRYSAERENRARRRLRAGSGAPGPASAGRTSRQRRRRCRCHARRTRCGRERRPGGPGSARRWIPAPIGSACDDGIARHWRFPSLKADTGFRHIRSGATSRAGDVSADVRLATPRQPEGSVCEPGPDWITRMEGRRSLFLHDLGQSSVPPLVCAVPSSDRTSVVGSGR
jgi:hypothetical protein